MVFFNIPAQWESYPSSGDYISRSGFFQLTEHQWTKDQLKRQIKNAIYMVFDAAKSRDFGILASMHFPSDELFSKFDFSAPYKRQTFSQALMHEEVAYSNISDFSYEIEGIFALT